MTRVIPRGPPTTLAESTQLAGRDGISKYGSIFRRPRVHGAAAFFVDLGFEIRGSVWFNLQGQTRRRQALKAAAKGCNLPRLAMLYLLSFLALTVFSIPFGYPTVDANEAAAIDVYAVTRSYSGMPSAAMLAGNLMLGDATDLRREVCLDQELTLVVKAESRDFYDLQKVDVRWGDGPVETFMPVNGAIVEMPHTYLSNSTGAGNVPISIQAYSLKIAQGLSLDTVVNRRDFVLNVGLCQQRVDLGVGYVARESTVNGGNPFDISGLDRKACAGEQTAALVSASPAPGVTIERVWVYWGDTLDQTVSPANPTVSIIEQDDANDLNPSGAIAGIVSHNYTAGLFDDRQSYPVALFAQEDTGEITQFGTFLTVYNDCLSIGV